jgi:hypothetical protein
MRKLLAAAVCAALLAACTRPQPRQAADQGAAPPAQTPVSPSPQTPPSTRGEPTVSYLPSKERVLTTGDASEARTEWRSLGLELSDLLALSHGAAVIVAPATLYSGQSALTEAGSLAPLMAVKVIGSTDWESTGARYRRLYQVKADTKAGPLAGWVDSSACALLIAVTPGLSAGVLERKIAISEGESRYSVLLLRRPGSAFLVDTSAYLFPDAFHPGGIVSARIEDVNGDGAPEVEIVADFIVSFAYLGASPLRAEIWLRERGTAFAPILRINRSFGTDEGYEYSSSRTVLDTDGDGFRETVKVVTDQQQQTETGESFRNALVSFFVYNGTEYVKDAAEDLPKLGTLSGPVTLEHRPGGSRSGSGANAAGSEGPAAAAGSGETVFVFDRSDTSVPAGGGRMFWYKVLTRDEREGWVRGSALSMEWVDPLKMNRQVFLGAAGAAQ